MTELITIDKPRLISPTKKSVKNYNKIKTPVDHAPPVDRWLIIIAVMSATLIQVLDTTIVNVALPHIQGALSASSDQISWMLTSYIVASAIFMPLTGYFTDQLGRKKYLLISIAGFTLSSMLCGTAHTLSQMVFYRILQGCFGAGLVPLSQTIMTDIYSKAELGKAMAIWGMGVMVGPILGPTIGGYLTEFANWRWIFYVNVPVGSIALFLAWYAIPNTPKKNRMMDWFGFIFLSLAIGAAQCFLDRGNQNDWFHSLSIRITLIIAIASFMIFLINNFRTQKKNTVFDMHIFKDRNFSIASLILIIVSLGLYGNMVIQPLFLENLLNYPVMTAGLVMAPRGIAAMISMIVVGKLITRVSPYRLIMVGVLLCIFSSYICSAFYTQQINIWWLIWPFLFQGFGLGMIFVPLSVIAFSTLSEKSRTEAAGLYSLLRTFGSSIGIAVTLTVLSRQYQIAWQNLRGFISPFNSALHQFLLPLKLSPTNPLSISIINQILAPQIQTIAFVNVFEFILRSFVLTIPLVLLLKYKK